MNRAFGAEEKKRFRRRLVEVAELRIPRERLRSRRPIRNANRGIVRGQVPQDVKDILGICVERFANLVGALPCVSQTALDPFL